MLDIKDYMKTFQASRVAQKIEALALCAVLKTHYSLCLGAVTLLPAPPGSFFSSWLSSGIQLLALTRLLFSSLLAFVPGGVVLPSQLPRPLNPVTFRTCL